MTKGYIVADVAIKTAYFFSLRRPHSSLSRCCCWPVFTPKVVRPRSLQHFPQDRNPVRIVTCFS
jgi:hypothetical protein